MLGQNVAIILLIVGWLLITAVTWSTGLIRPSAIGDFDRPPSDAAKPLLIVLFAGFFAWIGAQSAYGAYLQMQFAAAHGAQARITEASFTTWNWAILSTFPPLAGFAILLIGNSQLPEKNMLASLGFSPARLPAGIVAGLIGSIIVVPSVYFLSALISVLYDKVHYQHPTEHELLLVMKSANGASKFLLIVGASIAAPLFEELLFRAHLQTLIRACLLWLTRPIAAVGQTPSALTNDPLSPTPSSSPPLLDYSINRRAVWQTWGAIFLASLLFASVHAMWMWPPIFVLSLGLGYAYERTGNLWTSITMHCVFNSVSTALYLHGVN